MVGDTVGDPFKDTQLGGAQPDHQVHDPVRPAGGGAGGVAHQGAGRGVTHVLAAVFLAVALFFVYRSFYGMRIEAAPAEVPGRQAVPLKV